MKKIILLMLSQAIFFESCMVQTPLGKNLKEINNANTTYLRSSFGPPDEIVDNAEAGEVWIYKHSIIVNQPGYITPGYGNTIYYSSPTSNRGEQYIKFWINSNKTVYRWQTNMSTKELAIGKTLFLCLGLGIVAGVILGVSSSGE